MISTTTLKIILRKMMPFCYMDSTIYTTLTLTSFMSHGSKKGTNLTLLQHKMLTYPIVSPFGNLYTITQQQALGFIRLEEKNGHIKNSINHYSAFNSDRRDT